MALSTGFAEVSEARICSLGVSRGSAASPNSLATDSNLLFSANIVVLEPLQKETSAA